MPPRPSTFASSSRLMRESTAAVDQSTQLLQHACESYAEILEVVARSRRVLTTAREYVIQASRLAAQSRRGEFQAGNVEADVREARSGH